MDEMRTLTEALEEARKDGFTDEFEAEEAGLRCSRTKDLFAPADVKIVRHERFEGPSSEDDAAALYFIETKNGLHGTIVDAYGTYANEHLANFIRKVRLDEDR